MIEQYKDALYLLGIFFSFIIGNKTKKIDDLAKYQGMYNTFVSQYEKQYKILKETVDSLQQDINNLQIRNAIIIEESQNWKEKFSILQGLYDKLKKEFDQYKTKHK